MKHAILKTVVLSHRVGFNASSVVETECEPQTKEYILRDVITTFTVTSETLHYY